jgi:hypothetical protein
MKNYIWYAVFAVTVGVIVTKLLPGTFGTGLTQDPMFFPFLMGCTVLFIEVILFLQWRSGQEVPFLRNPFDRDGYVIIFLTAIMIVALYYILFPHLLFLAIFAVVPIAMPFFVVGAFAARIQDTTIKATIIFFQILLVMSLLLYIGSAALERYGNSFLTPLAQYGALGLLIVAFFVMPIVVIYFKRSNITFEHQMRIINKVCVSIFLLFLL